MSFVLIAVAFAAVLFLLAVTALVLGAVGVHVLAVVYIFLSALVHGQGPQSSARVTAPAVWSTR